MSQKTDLKFLNGREFQKALQELGPQIAGKLGDAALRAGARVIIKEARRNVPVKTGELKKSITYQTARIKARDKRKGFIGFKKPTSRRAHLTEFGTSKSRAQPFLRPALDTQHSEALEAMRDSLARGILRKEWKKAVTFLTEGGDLDFGEE